MTTTRHQPADRWIGSRDQLAHALALAADIARVDYGDHEPMVARLRAGADRIRQETAR